MPISPVLWTSSCTAMGGNGCKYPLMLRELRVGSMWWSVLPFVTLLTLTGCGDRPSAEVLAPRHVPDQAATGAQPITAYAVTTRSRDPLRPYAFGSERAVEPHYASFTVSVPPVHAAGAIEWPDGPPDPQKHFVTVRQQILGRETLLQQLRSDDCGGSVGVFVHGYNHSFQEALYRVVQMSADARVRECAVLFAWPSSARAIDYTGDRDSADYSRQALADLMTDLAQESRLEAITIFAHSMGARLTMESLRQLRQSGEDNVLDRLEVILVAPDIDLDVFREQVGVVGPMKTPLAVLVAPDDQALRLSERISGNRPRLGTLAVGDPRISAAAETAGIQIIDIGAVPATRLAHDRYVALARLHQDRDGRNKPQQLSSTGTFVFDAIGRTLDRVAEGVNN